MAGRDIDLPYSEWTPLSLVAWYRTTPGYLCVSPDHLIYSSTCSFLRRDGLEYLREYTDRQDPGGGRNVAIYIYQIDGYWVIKEAMASAELWFQDLLERNPQDPGCIAAYLPSVCCLAELGNERLFLSPSWNHDFNRVSGGTDRNCVCAPKWCRFRASWWSRTYFILSQWHSEWLPASKGGIWQ